MATTASCLSTQRPQHPSTKPAVRAVPFTFTLATRARPLPAFKVATPPAAAAPLDPFLCWPEHDVCDAEPVPSPEVSTELCTEPITDRKNHGAESAPTPTNTISAAFTVASLLTSRASSTPFTLSPNQTPLGGTPFLPPAQLHLSSHTKTASVDLSEWVTVASWMDADGGGNHGVVAADDDWLGVELSLSLLVIGDGVCGVLPVNQTGGKASVPRPCGKTSEPGDA